MAMPSCIHPLKGGVLQQPRGSRKTASAAACACFDHVGIPTKRRGPVGLLAVTRFHGDALASLRAPTAQHRLPALGLHPATETVLLAPLPPVWLKCTLRHAAPYDENFAKGKLKV